MVEGAVQVEAIVATVLRALLDANVPIRALSLGRGLEKRVMELT